MRYKKHATYLLFGVVGFTLFVSAFSASSYKYYKTDHSSGVEYWIISPDYPVWPPKQLTEIAYDDYKAELRKGIGILQQEELGNLSHTLLGDRSF